MGFLLASIRPANQLGSKPSVEVISFLKSPAFRCRQEHPTFHLPPAFSTSSSISASDGRLTAYMDSSFPTSFVTHSSHAHVFSPSQTASGLAPGLVSSGRPF